MPALTLICTVPTREGQLVSYYAVPAPGGDSCIRLTGWQAMAEVRMAALRGAMAWLQRRAGRQADVLADGSIRFQPGEAG
jgi:hypothetical protein